MHIRRPDHPLASFLEQIEQRLPCCPLSELPTHLGTALEAGITRRYFPALADLPQLTGSDAVDGGHFMKTALFTQGMSLAGGTDEIQRNLIGERELGLPKEPDPPKGLPFEDLPR